MAKGTTLQELERRLRLETGRPLTTMAGDDESTKLRLRLAIAQETIFEMRDWRGFGFTHDVVVEAGQEYLDIPDRMHLAKTVRVYVSGTYGFEEIHRGFDTRDMNTTGLPSVMYWDLVSQEDIGLTDDPSQDPGVFFNPKIRLFPVPDRDITLRIEGNRKLRRLTQADDRAELDDTMIVLYAAAQEAGRSNDLRYSVLRAEARRSIEDQTRLDNQYGASALKMPDAPRNGTGIARLPRPRV